MLQAVAAAGQHSAGLIDAHLAAYCHPQTWQQAPSISLIPQGQQTCATAPPSQPATEDSHSTATPATNSEAAHEAGRHHDASAAESPAATDPLSQLLTAAAVMQAGRQCH